MPPGILHSPGYTPVGTLIGVTHAHDEVILVGVAQKRVGGRYLIDEVDGAVGEVYVLT